MVMHLNDLVQSLVLIVIEHRDFDEKIAEVREKAKEIIKEYTKRENGELCKKWRDYKLQHCDLVVRKRLMRKK